MSIEKELLKRILDVLRGLEETHYDLYWDIQSELEKIEQKPKKREPLSKDEYMRFFLDTYENMNPITDFVRAIEKEHGIGVENEN